MKPELNTMPVGAVELIAEIGCNHQGDLEIAKKMINTAINFCDVRIIKFQKRTPREAVAPDLYDRPHPNPANAFGKTYGEHREYLEFTASQHLELKEYCESLGGVYFASVWDLTAAEEILKLRPDMIKIPSAHNLNFPLLKYLAEHYQGEIHVSFGMTTPEEEETILQCFEERGRGGDLVVYSCVSGYPVAFEDLSLLDIRRLRETYGERVKHIGFSGHHLGIAADVAAAVLGARFIERHFTLDRTWKGTDHAASLEPEGLRKLSRDIQNVGKALRYKSAPVLDVEIAQRNKLKRITHG